MHYNKSKSVVGQGLVQHPKNALFQTYHICFRFSIRCWEISACRKSIGNATNCKFTVPVVLPNSWTSWKPTGSYLVVRAVVGLLPKLTLKGCVALYSTLHRR